VTTVLVVEDSAPLGRLLETTLRGAGYDVVWAQTAAIAIEASAARQPDVVLVDRYLGETSGVELAQVLRRDRGHARLVLMSGEAPTADLEPVFDAFLLKPVAIATLLRAVAA
jgi:DNA-binding response OmpR family regulator